MAEINIWFHAKHVDFKVYDRIFAINFENTFEFLFPSEEIVNREFVDIDDYIPGWTWFLVTDRGTSYQKTLSLMQKKGRPILTYSKDGFETNIHVRVKDVWSIFGNIREKIFDPRISRSYGFWKLSGIERPMNMFCYFHKKWWVTKPSGIQAVKI